MDYCYYCMHKKTNNGFCGHCGHKQPEKSEALHHLPIGVVLNNRYLIGRVLGEGGFGITYIGRDLNLDMIVAVKEYFPMGYVSRNSNADVTVSVSIGDNKSFFDRGRAKFINEAKTLAKFSGNRSIVDVRDYFECNNTAYIVMEYIQGETLSKYINENGLFTFSALYSSLRPVLIALENIHGTGLIHRDISPDNIMIMNDGSLKLMDFGAARDANFDDQRSLSIVLRPGYAPEEQYRSKGKQGPWTDVYAICATIYKCITGVTPEDSMNRIFSDTLKKPSQLGAVISPAQEQALMAGLRVHQRDRIQTVENLIAAFDGTKKVYAPVPQAYPSYGKQESRTVAADDRTVAANPSAPARFTVQNNNGGNDRSPKKSNKKIIIIIAVIVAVLIAAGATIGIIAAVNSNNDSSSDSSSSAYSNTRASSSKSESFTESVSEYVTESNSEDDPDTAKKSSSSSSGSPRYTVETTEPDFVSGDFGFYRLGTDEVKVTQYNGNAKDVTIPATVNGYKVTAIERSLFRNSEIESVTIPEGVTEIGSYAFSNCLRLKEIVVPDGVTTIGNNAFWNCRSLEKLTLPSSLENIGSYAFSATGLKTVTIPESSTLTSLSDRAFFQSFDLSEVILPSSMTDISNDAFDQCADGLTIKSPAGSYGISYAKEKGFKYVEL